MNILQIRKAIKDGTTSCLEEFLRCKKLFEDDNKTETPLNAIIEFFDDSSKLAEKADEEIANARKNGTLDELFAKKPLLGVSFAVKDNISVRGKSCTCCSKILDTYISPYNATVIQRLLDCGAIPVGRANMDEFAMGSSTEHSCYGPTRNPVNRDYAPGGSSGGSAAAVVADQAAFALGSETGGSVRLPASYCGLYGYKPTYGVLSRWGVVAFGSSLDQVGLFGNSVDDIAIPLSVMAGKDVYDDTSCDLPLDDIKVGEKGIAPLEVRGLKVAIPKQFLVNEGLDEDVAKTFEATKEWFEKNGATVKVVDLPILDTSLACYYVIALSEAASNLSRFDGIRYGNRIDEGKGYDDLYIKTRSEGFGDEVKRRIVIGNYVLSTNFSGDCYKTAMNVRHRMQKEINEVFEKFDFMICPTCPTPPFKLGSRIDDPLTMYLSDFFTIFVNLARVTAISVPAGLSKDKLPIGIQFVSGALSDGRLLRLAKSWEVR